MDWFAIFEFIFEGLYHFGNWLTADLGRAAMIMVGVVAVYIALRLVFKLLKAILFLVIIIVVFLVAWIYLSEHFDIPSPEDIEERIEL